MKRTPLRKISERQKEKNIEKTSRTKKLHEFFLTIWDGKENEDGDCICYETGKILRRASFKGNSCTYHHILEKNIYPEYEFKEWNIVILHPEIHAQVHADIDRCPKIKELTEQLKKKYL